MMRLEISDPLGTGFLAGENPSGRDLAASGLRCPYGGTQLSAQATSYAKGRHLLRVGRAVQKSGTLGRLLSM